MKTNLYMMRLVSCICVLAFCASCVPDVTTEPSAKSLHKTDALTVFFTGNELGEMRPCGCSGGQLGGLSRRATVFNRVPKHKRLIVDTGSLVKSQSEQDLIKFNIIIEAFSLLDYDLVSLTEEDIEMGKNVGLLDGTVSGFNIISPHGPSGVNVPVKFTKRLPLKGKTVVVTIAAFDAKSSPIEQIGQLFTSASDVNPAPVRSESNLDTRPSWLGQAETGRLNILILNHCDDAIIDFIAERIPLVDYVVCPAESDEPMVSGEANKRPLVFSVGRFGRYVCGLQITEDRGQKTEDRGQKTEDRGQKTEDRGQKTEDRGQKTEDRGQKTEDRGQRTEDRRQITEAAGDKDKLKLSFFAVPVGEDLEEEASLVRLYKDYQQLVRERNLLEKYPRFILPDGLEYAGSESCKACHEYEYGKWGRNVHAHAYAILERVGSQFDPECAACHVVGMKYESGFVSEQKTGHLKNVGCENCHGPGSEHIRTLGNAGFTGPKSACIDCHTPENSGDYAGNEGAFLEKIVHWREPKPSGSVK